MENVVASSKCPTINLPTPYTRSAFFLPKWLVLVYYNTSMNSSHNLQKYLLLNSYKPPNMDVCKEMVNPMSRHFTMETSLCREYRQLYNLWTGEKVDALEACGING